MEKTINPSCFQTHFSFKQKVANWLYILGVALPHAIMIILGLFVCAVAIPFSKKEGIKNMFLWQMEKLPSWAWMWSNDYDGIQGQKNGKNYTDYPLDSYKGKYHWTAIRNPANNWGRYFIGFSYEEVSYIFHDGPLDIDENSSVQGFAMYRAYIAGTRFYFPAVVYNNGKIWFKLGWKIDSFRYADRPWAGFTISGGKVKK